ncbi:MAG: hypothetical protein LAQ69_22135 [Acidobacteriia bacterium]|nr:hypothetical protein [Terriglobia bacterium]
MPYARLAALLTALIALAIATSCRSAGPPPVIDPALASCVPIGTVVLAGIDLDRLRSTSLYRSLPPATLANIETLRDASYLLLASNGKDLLFIARGAFREAPPGATLIAPNLAISGSADSVRAATTQHKTGITGAPQLLDRAAGIAGGRQIWLVAQGGITLPLTGNAANLNRILHFTEYITLAAQIDSGLQLDAAGVCRTTDAGRQLEESLRAILTFAVAGSGGPSGLTAIWNAVEIRRDDLTVHATLSTNSESAEKLLRELTR